MEDSDTVTVSQGTVPRVFLCCLLRAACSMEKLCKF